MNTIAAETKLSDSRQTIHNLSIHSLIIVARGVREPVFLDFDLLFRAADPGDNPAPSALLLQGSGLCTQNESLIFS